MSGTQLGPPPELYDSNNERIVVFVGANGYFSNHPEYDMRMALQQDKDQREALAKAEADAAAQNAANQAEDDVPVSPNDGDGVTTYAEMQTKELVALAKSRNIELVPPIKRAALIALLEQHDQGQE